MNSTASPSMVEDQAWIRHQMPVIIQLAVKSDDRWIRQAISGSEGVELPPLQLVIVQGTEEAERVVNAMANLKEKRHLQYGGALHRRAVKGADY